MISETESSRRSGSSGPRPMISSVICSSMRTRSARVRARPSSSMTRLKISSIWRRTSTWLVRSSFGSRSWMTRFWIRNLTSRNDSRAGSWVTRRGWAVTPAPVPPLPPSGWTSRPPPCPVGTGRFSPGPPGRADSMRFSSDIFARSPYLSEREDRLASGRTLGGLLAWTAGDRCGRWAGDGCGEACDVLRHLGLPVAEEERNAAVQRVDHAAAVAHDRVIDLPSDGVLDVCDADAEGRVRAVQHEPDLLRAVAELLADLEEQAHVLHARDFEREEREDQIGFVEDGERRVVEARWAVHDDQVEVLPRPLDDLLDRSRADELGLLRRRRGQEDPDAGGVADHEGVEGLGLAAALELARKIRDRLVARVEVEQDADVPELERGVDQPDLLAGLRGGHGQVHGDRGPADAPLGAEDRDHIGRVAAAVVVAPVAARRGDDRRVARLLVLLAAPDLPDRGR